MASATAADGYTYPKGLYYEVNVSSGTPVLVKQGVIDPGPGVSVQMPAVDIDSRGDLGFSWMEASSTEYLSMWIGSLTPRATSVLMTWLRAAASSPITSASATTARSSSIPPTAPPSGRPTSTSGPTAAPTSGGRISPRSRFPRQWTTTGTRSMSRPAMRSPCNHPPRRIKAASSSTPPIAQHRALRHLRQPGRRRHSSRRRPQRGPLLQRSGHRPVLHPRVQQPGQLGRVFPVGQHPAVRVGRHLRPGLQRPQRQRQPGVRRSRPG